MLKLAQFEDWFREAIVNEPDWRSDANREADYNDGKQLTTAEREDMLDRGYSPVVINMIRPTLASAIGLERQYKQDFRVFADDLPDTDLARALNQELSQAERLSRADMEISEAYAKQVKHGVGWVEVAGEIDSMQYPIAVNHIDRNEIYWDWHHRKYDGSDMRYLIRNRWVDADMAAAQFPKHKKLIESSVGDIANFDDTFLDDVDSGLRHAWATAEDQSTIDEQQWRDVERKRVKIYEVWYRVPTQAYILRTNTGFVVEFDDNNNFHRAAVVAGAARLDRGFINKVRLAWYVGPHIMSDEPSPYKHGRFPYVGFWAFKEDRTRRPYGLIRDMISPQDSINSRLSKMEWLLSAKMLIADDDAFAGTMTEEEVAEEITRPDAYLRLNANRTNKQNKPEIIFDRELATQQHQVMNDMMVKIQDTAGIHQQFLGKSDQSMSGVAISGLVEQSALSLAEINDNYAMSRQLVGELMLYFVRQMIGSNEKEILLSRDGRESAFIFNKRGDDGAIRDNDLMRVKTRVELGSAPETPTYKQQKRRDLMELMKSIPDEAKAPMLPEIVRLSDFDESEKFANKIEEQFGMGSAAEGEQAQPNPEQLRAEAFAEVGQAQDMERMQMEMDKLRAEIDEKSANTALKLKKLETGQVGSV